MAREILERFEISQNDLTSLFGPIDEAEDLLRVAQEARIRKIEELKVKVQGLTDPRLISWAHPLIFPWVSEGLGSLVETNPAAYVAKLALAGKLLQKMEEQGKFIVLAFPSTGSRHGSRTGRFLYHHLIIGVSNGTIKSREAEVEIPLSPFVFYDTEDVKTPRSLKGPFIIPHYSVNPFWKSLANGFSDKILIFAGSAEECKKHVNSPLFNTVKFPREDFDKIIESLKGSEEASPKPGTIAAHIAAYHRTAE